MSNSNFSEFCDDVAKLLGYMCLELIDCEPCETDVVMEYIRDILMIVGFECTDVELEVIDSAECVVESLYGYISDLDGV